MRSPVETNLKHNRRYLKKTKANHPWKIAWAKIPKDIRDFNEFVSEGVDLGRRKAFRFPINPKYRHNKYAI